MKFKESRKVREPQTPVILFSAIAVAFALILIHVLNWRCPACGRSLGHSLSPKFCAMCGVRLVR